MLEKLRRRLPPAERAEAAKAQQAREPRELPAGSDGLPYGPNARHFPEAAEALRKFDQARRGVEDKRRELQAAGEEPPVCELHDWSPPAPFLGAPRPPKSRCPFCRGEAAPSGTVAVIKVEHPLNTKREQADAGREFEQLQERKREEELLALARDRPESFAAQVFRTPEGLAAVRSGVFADYVEGRGLEEIGEARQRDMSNLLETHQDFPRSSGPFYRRGAFVGPGASRRRRVAATKYWKRTTAR